LQATLYIVDEVLTTIPTFRMLIDPGSSIYGTVLSALLDVTPKVGKPWQRRTYLYR
jgi:hypothetical protein